MRALSSTILTSLWTTAIHSRVYRSPLLLNNWLHNQGFPLLLSFNNSWNSRKSYTYDYTLIKKDIYINQRKRYIGRCLGKSQMWSLCVPRTLQSASKSVSLAKMLTQALLSSRVFIRILLGRHDWLNHWSLG